MSFFKARSLSGATPVSLYPTALVLVPWAGSLGFEAHPPHDKTSVKEDVLTFLNQNSPGNYNRPLRAGIWTRGCLASSSASSARS